jgi:adenine phosphoribosyltransferase
VEEIRRFIREVADFPKPGVTFRDVTPLFANPAGFARAVAALAERYASRGVTDLLAIESRGFIIGAALAQRLGCGLALARKPGKLPRPTYSAPYALEYGFDRLEVHQDALSAASRVVLVDDLIATGGTMGAACRLAQACGAEVLEGAALIELRDLDARRALPHLRLHSLVSY